MFRKVTAALAVLMLVAGCTTTDPVTGEREPNRTANGAIIGAIVGAGAGTLAGGDDGRNAAIGGVIGALAGGAIGNYMDRTYQNLRERLAGTGVGVERINQEKILLIFPADLTFDLNRDSVKSQFLPVLNNTGSILREYEQTTVDVYGFADCTGADAYNQDLSERRASNVATVLASNGVIRQRIITQGFGETRPVTQPCSAAANRRVEVTISAFTGR
ncbi:MAG: OmpA family protein [Hyphomonadaceae bacterium]|nr:OmpA family protein [Hyphomonadaceae bacterium]